MSLVGLLSTVFIITYKLHESLRLFNLRLSLYIIKQKAAILNTCCIDRKFSVEEWKGSAWSVRPVLFWEPAKLLWSKESGWWWRWWWWYIRDNEKRTLLLIDNEISGDWNVIKKTIKYKDLTTEIERTCMWNVQYKMKLIPVTIGANASISKSLRQYLSNVMETSTSRNYRKQPYWALHIYSTLESTDVKVQNIYCWKQYYLYHIP